VRGFPDRELPGPVKLGGVADAVVAQPCASGLRQEWEAACAATAGLYMQADAIDGYTESEPYQHQVAAIDAATALAYDHQRRIAEITWHYASAAVVLGAAVMDRLLAGSPALSPVLVEHLAGHEACLGGLLEACDGTYERLITEQDDDAYRTEAQARKDLLAELKGLYYNVIHTHGRRPLPERIGGRRNVVGRHLRGKHGPAVGGPARPNAPVRRIPPVPHRPLGPPKWRTGDRHIHCHREPRYSRIELTDRGPLGDLCFRDVTWPSELVQLRIGPGARRRGRRRASELAAAWHGSPADPASYRTEGGGGEAPVWRLYRLDPHTLRPTGTPLFEQRGAGARDGRRALPFRPARGGRHRTGRRRRPVSGERAERASAPRNVE
jgi:hypothetical protein